MGIFKSLERKLEKAVEGLFSKAFEAKVQPIEIAKRIASAMDEGRTVGPERVYAPNIYQVFLASQDYEKFNPFKEALLSEIAHYLNQKAEKEGYFLLGPVEISLSEDANLTPGDFKVDYRIVELGEESGALEETQSIALEEACEEKLHFAPAYLEILDEGKKVYLSKARLTIGRDKRNDIVLNNLGVSRTHAQIIRRRHNRFVLRDLESTNGSFVNGRPVKEKVLKDGDIITLGEIKLEFRRTDTD
jgi:hypothetical protein